MRLGRFDLGALVALVALAYASLAGLVLRTLIKGGVVTGGDGFLVADPLQYLNWLRQIGEHGAAGNLYDLAPGPRTFVHPGLLLAGLLHDLGVGLVASYHVWKLPAALVLFAGTLVLVRRHLESAADRRLALVVALFFASPLAALGAGPGGFRLDLDFIAGEMTASNWLWGYHFTAVAVGLVPLALIAFERDRIGLAAGAALLCTWLQPWQGMVLLLTLAAAELATARRLGRLAVCAAAGALPAVYYLVLSRIDPSWELAGRVNALPRWGIPALLVSLAPLAVPAVLAGRGRRTFADVALRAWPAAVLVVYLLPFGTFPFHAFQGLAVPLAVLAVIGLGGRLRGAWAVLAVAVLVVPGTLHRVNALRDAVTRGYQPFFLTAGERAALRDLEARREPGGVLAPIYSGLAVPAYTGRETWIGAGSWTPDFVRRRESAEALFDGRMDATAAARLVRASRARFLLGDCHGRADITRIVAGFTDPPRRFGCATVWRVRG